MICKEVCTRYNFKIKKITKIAELGFNLEIHCELEINRLLYNTNLDK